MHAPTTERQYCAAAMITVWLLIILLAVKANAINFCTQEDSDVQRSPMQQCFASCLDLVDVDQAKRQPCYYNAASGKSQGCGKPVKPNSKKRVLLCDASAVYDWGVEHLKPCDMIYIPVINFNTTSDVVFANSNAKDSLRNAPKLRQLGIKVIGQIEIWETAENVMRISEKAELRSKFAASIKDVVEELQLDGIYFNWMYPGCPMGGNCKSANPHKKYTIELITEIGKPLKDSRRVLIMHISDNPFTYGFLTDYSEVMPYVDYFIVQTNGQVSHGNSRTGFNFNLKLTRDYVRNVMSKAKDLLFSRRLLLTFNMHILSYQLNKAKDGKIGDEHDRNGKKYSTHLKLSEWCKLVRPGSGYKVVPSNDTQNYAVKDDHLFVFDDVTSLKEKMDWFMSIGGGAHVFNTWADDHDNECGCGRSPFIRTLGDLAKSADCDPMPCF